MAVMARETWTDERMDDLSKRVDDGFARTDRQFAEVRAEIKATANELRAEIKTSAEELRGEIRGVGVGVDTLQDRFARLQNILIAGLLGGVFTIVVGFLSILAAVVL